jgi:hypothetical protein
MSAGRSAHDLPVLFSSCSRLLPWEETDGGGVVVNEVEGKGKGEGAEARWAWGGSDAVVALRSRS